MSNRMLLIVLLISLSACGASVISQNKTGDNRALFRASSDGRIESVRSLLDAGADVNAREEENETPLMYAAVEGHTEVVLLLISRGADVNALSDNKETALGRAAMRGRN